MFELTPFLSTLQDNPNEWSFCWFGKLVQKLERIKNLFYSLSHKTEWSFYEFSSTGSKIGTLTLIDISNLQDK